MDSDAAKLIAEAIDGLGQRIVEAATVLAEAIDNRDAAEEEELLD